MPSVESHTDYQAAVRLLACISAGSAPVEGPDYGNGVVGVLRAQSRLQALDFWVRYPDYLANELINEFEEKGDPADLDLARRILDDREPDLRRVPMIRFHFGAYEPIHNALSILRSLDLVRQQKSGKPGRVSETTYLLMAAGRDAMQSLADSAPELAWYRDRAEVAVRVAGGSGGAALKGRQYLQEEYAATPLNSTIPPIEERVRVRLRKIDEGVSV